MFVGEGAPKPFEQLRDHDGEGKHGEAEPAEAAKQSQTETRKQDPHTEKVLYEVEGKGGTASSLEREKQALPQRASDEKVNERDMAECDQESRRLGEYSGLIGQSLKLGKN